MAQPAILYLPIRRVTLYPTALFMLKLGSPRNAARPVQSVHNASIPRHQPSRFLSLSASCLFYALMCSGCLLCRFDKRVRVDWRDYDGARQLRDLVLSFNSAA